MAKDLGSRERFLVVLVAVLSSVSGPVFGFRLNQPARENLNQPAVSNGEIQAVPQNSKFPNELGVSCAVDVTLADCTCEVIANVTLMGKPVSFKPRINAKFVDKNASIVVTVSDKDQVFFTHEISGRESIPPICMVMPQFPFATFCCEFHNLSFSLEDKTVSVCMVLGLDTTPVKLPMHPTLPMGCFKAGPPHRLEYNPPEFIIQGAEQVNQLIGSGQTPFNNKPSPLESFPPPLANNLSPINNMLNNIQWPFSFPEAPFDAINQALTWPRAGTEGVPGVDEVNKNNPPGSKSPP